MATNITNLPTTTIILKSSVLKGRVPSPSDLELGEIALGLFEGEEYIWIKNTNGDVVNLRKPDPDLMWEEILLRFDTEVEFLEALGRDQISFDSVVFIKETGLIYIDGTYYGVNAKELEGSLETLREEISNLNESKVDKVEGKDLSSNDLTDEYVNILETIDDTYATKEDIEDFATIDDITLDATEETVSVEIGGITEGTDLSNKTALEILEMMLYKELYPTLTSPSITSFSSSVSGNQEVGNTKSITFTTNFSRGSISPSYGTSGYRSGLPSGYTYSGTGLPTSKVFSTDLSNTQIISDHVFTPGTITWSVSVSYNEGEQPLSSKGNNYSSPLSAGSVSRSLSLTSVYAYFATTKLSNEITEQSIPTSRSTTIDLVMVSEMDGGEGKQSAAFGPNVVVGSIEYYNTFSGSWDEITSDFTRTDWVVAEYFPEKGELYGEDCTFSLYTHNLAGGVGSRTIRFNVTYS